MKKLVQLLSIGGLWLMAACQQPQPTTVVCIGDSITEGYGLANQSQTAYPFVMQQILGDQYRVINCGRSATTLQKEGDFPYWITKEFANVFQAHPQIITIKLGTNDTKPQNWNAERFKKDYQALIDTLSQIDSHPKIYLCLPVPVYQTTWGINDSTVVQGVIPAIKELAANNKLEIIDFYTALSNQAADFPDFVHPNEAAEALMAQVAAQTLKP